MRDGRADAGVVPVESSLVGTIRENADLLWAFDLPIVGEVSVPVRLALLGLPGERLETVERVYSITAALAQADEFLRSRPWTIQTTYNTAGAARMVAERGERGSAAVASRPGRGDLRARRARRRHPVGRPTTTPGSRSSPGAATRCGPRRRAAGGRGRPRRGRRSCSPSGTSPGSLAPVARRVRDPRAQPRRGWSRGRGPSAARAGSTCSGSTSTGTRPSPCAPTALADLARETELVRILGTYPRAAED